ncbi:antibiotic biosynthesis monooxygenase [Chloroflexi bacterium TSY]|nr:antibiotic biosynthesis monooxygenase [Chloroflexi bacterium TSY]
MSEFITFKRWSLNEGRQESELVALIQNEIVPTYQKLPGCISIGLLRIDGTRAYLATQHWESRAARDAATSSAFYQEWFESYKPTLERWDELMTFEDEWESEDIPLVRLPE